MSDTKIKPRFDFREFDPRYDTNYVGTHESIRQLRNGVRPALFNEYERVIQQIADIIGDYDFDSITNTAARQSIGGIINYIWNTLTQNLDDKYDKSGGEISGNVDISGGGLKVEWKPGVYYTQDQIVLRGYSIYKSTIAHESGQSFTQDYEQGRWEIIRTSADPSFSVHQDGHGFQDAEVLTVNNEGIYVRAVAGELGSAGTFVVSEVTDIDNFRVINAGYVEYDPDAHSIHIGEFTPGNWYYLDPTEPGRLTLVEPDLSQPIFFATTGTSGIVVNWRPDHLLAGFHKLYIVPEPSAGPVDPDTDTQQYFEIDRMPPKNYMIWVTVNGADQPSETFSFHRSPFEEDFGIVKMDASKDLSIRYLITKGENPQDLTEGYVYKQVNYTPQRLTKDISRGVYKDIHCDDSGNIVVVQNEDGNIFLSKDAGVNFYEFSHEDDANVRCSINRESGEPIIITNDNIIIIDPTEPWGTSFGTPLEIANPFAERIQLFTMVYPTERSIVGYNQSLYIYNEYDGEYVQIYDQLPQDFMAANSNNNHIDALHDFEENTDIIVICNPNKDSYIVSETPPGGTISPFEYEDTFDNGTGPHLVRLDPNGNLYLSINTNPYDEGLYKTPSNNYGMPYRINNRPVGSIVFNEDGTNVLASSITSDYSPNPQYTKELHTPLGSSNSGATFVQTNTNRAYLKFTEALEEHSIVSIKSLSSSKYIPGVYRKSHIYIATDQQTNFEVKETICDGDMPKDKHLIDIYTNGSKIPYETYSLGEDDDYGYVITEPQTEGTSLEIICTLSEHLADIYQIKYSTYIGSGDITLNHLSPEVLHYIEKVEEYRGNVTTERLADGSVTTPKIRNNHVTTEKIVNQGVTTDKIANNSVTRAKLDETISLDVSENIIDNGKFLIDHTNNKVDGYNIEVGEPFKIIDRWHVIYSRNTPIELNKLTGIEADITTGSSLYVKVPDIDDNSTDPDDIIAIIHTVSGNEIERYIGKELDLTFDMKITGFNKEGTAKATFCVSFHNPVSGKTKVKEYDVFNDTSETVTVTIDIDENHSWAEGNNTALQISFVLFAETEWNTYSADVWHESAPPIIATENQVAESSYGFVPAEGIEID